MYSSCHHSTDLRHSCCRALLYCMEYLEDNLDDWLSDELEVSFCEEFLQGHINGHIDRHQRGQRKSSCASLWTINFPCIS